MGLWGLGGRRCWWKREGKGLQSTEYIRGIIDLASSDKEYRSAAALSVAQCVVMHAGATRLRTK